MVKKQTKTQQIDEIVKKYSASTSEHDRIFVFNEVINCASDLGYDMDTITKYVSPPNKGTASEVFLNLVVNGANADGVIELLNSGYKPNQQLVDMTLSYLAVTAPNAYRHVSEKTGLNISEEAKTKLPNDYSKKQSATPTGKKDQSEPTEFEIALEKSFEKIGAAAVEIVADVVIDFMKNSYERMKDIVYDTSTKKE